MQAAAWSELDPVRHVLAVDDEAVSRLVLVRMLQGLELAVTEATDVPEAIDLVRRGGFDLVVSDYQMPNGTGLELAEAAADVGIPFILLTGVGGHGSFEDNRLQLIDAHLTKPVSTSELGDVVGMVLCPAAVQTSGVSQQATTAVDRSVLQRLTTDLGDEAVTISVVEAFLADLDERCYRLVAAMAAGRREEARREAHTLAAPSATVGAVELAAWCQTVERDRSANEVLARPTALYELAEATRLDLEQWLETTSPAALPRP